MTRRFYKLSALALAAAAPLLLGGCTATDTAGNMSAATTAPRPGAASTTGAASNAAAPQASADTHAGDVRRMGPDELRKLIEAGQAAVYDTRSKLSYDQEHIKGSLSMPHEEVAARAAEFPKDKTLVFYCT